MTRRRDPLTGAAVCAAGYVVAPLFVVGAIAMAVRGQWLDAGYLLLASCVVGVIVAWVHWDQNPNRRIDNS